MGSGRTVVGGLVLVFQSMGLCAWAEGGVNDRVDTQPQRQQATGSEASPPRPSAKTQAPSSAVGGAGNEGGPPSGRLTGRVVSASPAWVWVEAQSGAVIPLRVDLSTRIERCDLQSAQDLNVGDEVHVSFDVQATENVAKDIRALPSARGGSGLAGGIPGEPSTQAGRELQGESRSVVDPDLSRSLKNPERMPDVEESRGPASQIPPARGIR